MLDQSVAAPLSDRPDPIPLILKQLADGNDVIRTGAVRAAAAIGIRDSRVRAALLASLLDEDPDVRTDAMDALVHCAKPEDADTVRQSLLGDPVREVKDAAIRALTLLKDENAVPVLRKLVASRAEDAVAWEDDSDAWDDWLDVQIAVIRALGKLGVTDSIQDILAARDDEAGQVLDGPVFAALAAMGGEGAVWLLSVAQTERGLGRKRALETLANMRSDLLTDYTEVMADDEAADVRRLALPLLAADDARAEAMVLRDPDADLRRDALCQFAPHRPDLAIKALSDQSELVQAAALEHLVLPVGDTLQASLIANVIAWTRLGKEKLAVAAARILPRLAPEQAAEPLLQLVRDTTRPLEARLAAVAALAKLDDVSATERLIALMGNETQQVRAVALTQLVARCRSGDMTAAPALAMSIDGTLLSPDRAVVAHPAEDGPDLAMSKTDDTSRSHLKISRDGDIVEMGPDEDIDAAQSTLGALQFNQAPAPAPEPELAEVTPEESAPKRRHRRPVEGPEAVADDLRVVALGIAGDLCDPEIEAAVFEAAESDDDILRLAAYRALLKQAKAGVLRGETTDIAKDGLADENPAIRSTAADILATTPKTAIALGDCLEDTDALVRAVAVRHCATPEQALHALSDTTSVVRQAALDKLLAAQDGTDATAVFNTLSQAERIDTLANACVQSEQVLTRAIQALAQPDLSPRQAHILLETLARGVRTTQ
jgi:HEAT repeat protein